jgi:hypothetical protein
MSTAQIVLSEAAVTSDVHDASTHAMAAAMTSIPSFPRAHATLSFALAGPDSAAVMVRAGAPEGAGEARGTPREQMTVPVSPQGPQGDFDDTFLLESPAGAGEAFYIPRYRLAVVDVNGGRQKHYRAALERRGAEWRFTVHLAAYAPDELGERAWSATPLESPYRVRLSGGGRTFDFQDAFVEEGGIRAVLTLADPGAHDALIALLTRPELGARLEVLRHLAVGLPVELADERDPLRVELARLRRMRVVRFREANPGMGDGTGRSQYLGFGSNGSGWGNQSGDSPEQSTFLLENLSREGEPCTGDVIALHTMGGGTVTGGGYQDGFTTPRRAVPSREQRILLRGYYGWSPDGPPDSNRQLYDVEGSPIGFGRQVVVSPSSMAHPINSWGNSENWSPGWYNHGYLLEEAPPGNALYAYLREQIAGVEQQIAAARKVFSTTHFVARTVELPWTAAPAPFALDANRHAYVYAGVPMRQDPGLVRHQVDAAAYYQDEAAPQRFYYLPDRFALEVLPGPPARPALAVRPTVDASTFLVEYTAIPVVDQARLARDADALLARANRGADRPFERVEFLPLLGDEPLVVVVVPRASEPDRRKRLPRPGALANLAARLTDAFAVTAEELQELFEALHAGGDSALFTGTVTLTMGDQNEEIPLSGRAPGDPGALWDAIFDRGVPARYLRTVQVEGAALFADTGVARAVVTFDRGGEVVLTPEQPGGSAQVSLPVEDFILRRDVSSDFRYRVELTCTDGGTASGDWQTARGAVVRPQFG